MVKTVVLSENEWNVLCNRTVDPETDQERCSALPICCANVSALRDQIIILRGRGGKLEEDNKRMLLGAFGWVNDSHSPNDWDWTTLNKLMKQIPTTD